MGGRLAFRSPVVFTYSPPHYYGHHFALEAMPSVPLIYPGYVAYPTPLTGSLRLMVEHRRLMPDHQEDLL